MNFDPSPAGLPSNRTSNAQNAWRHGRFRGRHGHWLSFVSNQVVFRARMLSETRKISATDVKIAVDQAVRESSFGAALNPIFCTFLNAGVEFPFKIFKVSADGGSKTSLDLRLEYNRSSSDTSTNTVGSTTVTDFEVVIPKNGWQIEIA